MPRGSISGQGRIQVSPPEDCRMAAPDSVVTIEDPESDEVTEAERVGPNGNDRERRRRGRRLRSRLAEPRLTGSARSGW
jgi:hypothetical protein